jgi:hypothetical protein
MKAVEKPCKVHSKVFPQHGSAWDISKAGGYTPFLRVLRSIKARISRGRAA